jgi:putative RecB family exonuclease
VTQYSHSRLSTFETCPRKFAFRYIEKVEVDTEGVEAFMGKRVHEVLERLHHHVSRYERPPSLAQVLERFRKDWLAVWHDRVIIVRAENPPEYYHDRGLRCLENYYRTYYPFDQGTSVGIEERLQLALDPAGRYRMIGIVDRIVSHGSGRYEIHDYKTGARLPSQSQIDQERQLALYQIGLEQTYNDVGEVELVWHYLIHNRTLRSRRTRDQLDELRDQTMQLIDRIESTQEYPAQPGPLCRWCDYQQLCPAGGTQSTNDRSPPQPVVDDPLVPADARLAPATTAEELGVQLSLLP